MGIFGKKKEKEVKDAPKKEVKKPAAKKETKKSAPKAAPKKKVKKAKEPAPIKITADDLSWVLKGPRITEKGTITATDARAYIFDVDPRATKLLVKQAISEYYKVTPIKVNITKVPYKSVTIKRKKGRKGGGKKAYVFLKEGESIEFV